MLTRRQLRRARRRRLRDRRAQHDATPSWTACRDRPPAQEIAQSKDVLEHLLGRPVDSFAYPHGYHDRASSQLVVDGRLRLGRRRQATPSARPATTASPWPG